MTQVDNLSNLPPEMLMEIALKLPMEEVAVFCQTSVGLNRVCQSEMFWDRRLQKDFPKYTSRRLPVTYKQYYSMLSKVWNFYPLERFSDRPGSYLVESIDIDENYGKRLGLIYPVPVFYFVGDEWFSDIEIDLDKEAAIISIRKRSSLIGPIPSLDNLPYINPQNISPSLQRSLALRIKRGATRGMTNYYCLTYDYFPQFLERAKQVGYMVFNGSATSSVEELTFGEILENHELFHDPKMSAETFAQQTIASRYPEYDIGQLSDVSYLEYGLMLDEARKLTNKSGESIYTPIDPAKLKSKNNVTLIYPVPLFTIKENIWMGDITIIRGKGYNLIGAQERQTLIGPIPSVPEMITPLNPNSIDINIRQPFASLFPSMISGGFKEIFFIKDSDYEKFLAAARDRGYFEFNTKNTRGPFAYVLDKNEISDHERLFQQITYY